MISCPEIHRHYDNFTLLKGASAEYADCIALRRNATVRVESMSDLLGALVIQDEEQRVMSAKLADFKVRVRSFSYEQLFSTQMGERLEHWRSMLRFLGHGGIDISAADFERLQLRETSHQQLGPHHHQAVGGIENMREITSLLTKTPFAALLS